MAGTVACTLCTDYCVRYVQTYVLYRLISMMKTDLKQLKTDGWKAVCVRKEFQAALPLAYRPNSHKKRLLQTLVALKQAFGPDFGCTKAAEVSAARLFGNFGRF